LLNAGFTEAQIVTVTTADPVAVMTRDGSRVIAVVSQELDARWTVETRTWVEHSYAPGQSSRATCCTQQYHSMLPDDAAALVRRRGTLSARVAAWLTCKALRLRAASV
jgi:hypothetical protein